jgi:hypothetical protein
LRNRVWWIAAAAKELAAQLAVPVVMQLSYNTTVGHGANSGMGGNGGAVYNDGNEIVLSITGSLLEHNLANEGGSAVFFVSNNKTGSNLFYRESALFIASLHDRDAARFRQFLLSVEDGQALESAFDAAFSESVASAWAHFVGSVGIASASQ